MVKQYPLTLLANIKPAERQALSEVLTEIGQDVNGNALLRFKEIPTTHFARFVMIGGGTLADRDAQTRLYFSANHDGPTADYVNLLVKTAPCAMHTIFSKCEGFPEVSCDHPSFAKRCIQYLTQHIVPTQTFYAAYPGHSVQEIHSYMELHRRLKQLMAREEFQPFLNALGELPAVPQKVHRAGTFERVTTNALNGLVEKIFTPEIRQDKIGLTSEVVDTQPAVTDWLYTVQNEMTVISANEPSKLKRLQRFLWIVNWASANVFNQGQLAGLSTIHFARWAVIDNGANLLFESNYDGNWEQYIGDFIDKASLGMDGVWSNAIGYPIHGSKDVQAFKKIIMDHQVRAHVFYSAYRYESVRNILDHIKVATQLNKLINQPAIADWFYRL